MIRHFCSALVLLFATQIASGQCFLRGSDKEPNGNCTPSEIEIVQQGKHEIYSSRAMIVKSPQSEPTLVLVTVSKDYNFLDVEIAHGLVDNHRFAIEAELTDTTSVDGRKAEMYAIPMDKELTRKIAESNYFRLRMGWRTGKAAFSLSDSPIIDQAQALIDTKNI